MSNTAGVLGSLEAGIKLESTRQKAIANNMANLNTPGYKRVDVKFNDILAQKIAQGEDVDDSQAELEIFQPLDTTVKPDGNDVSLDTEVGELVKNSLRHKAYTRLLARTYRNLDTAINFNR
jgi:flagellar basal-body rod protein FlgB